MFHVKRRKNPDGLNSTIKSEKLEQAVIRLVFHVKHTSHQVVESVTILSIFVDSGWIIESFSVMIPINGLRWC